MESGTRRDETDIELTDCIKHKLSVRFKTESVCIPKKAAENGRRRGNEDRVVNIESLHFFLVELLSIYSFFYYTKFPFNFVAFLGGVLDGRCVRRFAFAQ